MQYDVVTVQTMLTRLRHQTPAMLDLLGRLVNQDSGSHDAAGVDRVGDILASEWSGLGFEEERRPVPGRGALRLMRRRFGGTGRLLILGHLDTVWPAGTAAEWPFSSDGTHAYGPGVGDMKGGLVMALFAVRALIEDGFDGLGEIACLFVPDEELGSTGSRAEIEREAALSDWTLVLEPARPGGGVIVGRGAVGAMVIEARGRTAHAAVNPEEGHSALRALAGLVGPLEDLSAPDQGRIVTVGMLNAGTARQVVPDHAVMHVDLRAADPLDASLLLAAIGDIVGRAGAVDLAVTLTKAGGMTRPVFPRDRGDTLYRLYAEEAARLGVVAPPLVTRGGSDGSFGAALGCPTLDGVGPVCFDTCSRRERIPLASLAERGALFAALVSRLPDEGPRWRA
ncbi:M20/M25/M40 family metallo-hydrolase [Zavarzinia sp.]|uniref:M20/M25/M40 family metallo-hydrolase n=1 Tax=Zavarzinia sp. TaxID=2027920 RepID=UPI003BB6F069